jgi:crotonobetainyl-CoA:carnitine CoA-transferase CaiB-like acyl-CoA transferase
MLTPPQGPFIMQRGAMGDAPSGAFLAGGVGTALFQRERTGKGVLVDVGLLGSAVWTLAVDLVPTSIIGRDPDKFGATVLSSPETPATSAATTLGVEGARFAACILGHLRWFRRASAGSAG